MTKKYSHKVEILSNVSGPSNRLHVLGHRESLGTLEKVFAKFRTDEKIQEYMSKVPDLMENDAEVGLFRIES